jgi:prolyl 4-hydroxylase
MIIKNFSPEWKLWIWTNVVNGFDKESIFNILLNHGFDYNLIKNELEVDPVKTMIWQRQYSQSELNKESEISILPLNKSLCDNPNSYRIDTNLIELYRIPDFLTYDECDSILEMNDEFLDIVEKRIDFTTGLETKENDVIEVQKYVRGEEDVFNPSSGNWTFIIFLNNIIEGGEIEFPKLGMKFKSIKGEAIVWNNKFPTGAVNPHNEYLNLPFDADEKSILIKTYSPKEKEVQEIILDESDDSFVEIK